MEQELFGGLPNHVSSNINNFQDRRPRSLSECIFNQKLDAWRYHEVLQRSHNEHQAAVADLLFTKMSTSLNSDDDAEAQQEGNRNKLRQGTEKKRRKEKQVVMFTDATTGERH